MTVPFHETAVEGTPWKLTVETNPSKPVEDKWEGCSAEDVPITEGRQVLFPPPPSTHPIFQIEIVPRHNSTTGLFLKTGPKLKDSNSLIPDRSSPCKTTGRLPSQFEMTRRGIMVRNMTIDAYLK